MTAERTALRWIWIDGPPVLKPTALDKDEFQFERGLPLWSIKVGAAYFKRDNAADYAHPPRTLMLDADTTDVHVEGKEPFFQTKKPEGLKQALRSPRLFDVHLVVGARDLPYRPHVHSQETLQLNFKPDGVSGGRKVVNDKTGDPIFETIGEAGPLNEVEELASLQRGFVHVVAEPLLPKSSKGDFLDQAGSGTPSQNDIRVPRLRLLQGVIRLKLKGGQSWLGNLDPTKALTPPKSDFELVLTPSGIEIVSAANLPGTPDRLEGVFQIAPRERGQIRRDMLDNKSGLKPSALTLTLLPRQTERLKPGLADSWMQAWTRAADPLLPDDDNLRCGIDIRALPASLPPAFRWPLFLNAAGDGLVVPSLAQADPPLAVDVPPHRLHIELRGSRGPDGTHEGAAKLATTRLRLATRAAAATLAKQLHAQGDLDAPEVPPATDGTVVVAEARPQQSLNKQAAAGYWTVSTIQATDKVDFNLQFTTATAASIPLAYNEHRLADALRRAVGWDEPRRHRSNGTTSERFSEAHRPIVSGYLPLERGWLQLPFPNLPPLDLEKDTSLLSVLPRSPSSVLEGFFRIGNRGGSAFVSGYSLAHAVPLGQSAPWSVTIEGASGAVVMAAITQSTSGAARGTLVRTRAVLKEPELGTRGLLWLSSDKPSELDALPRLSAGPGSFLDVDLETTPAPDPKARVVTPFLSNLSLSYDNQGTAERNKLNMTIAFNPDSVIWKTGQAGTSAGRSALDEARGILLGPETQPKSAVLSRLRNVLSDEEGRLLQLESDRSATESYRDALMVRLLQAMREHKDVLARRDRAKENLTKAKNENNSSAIAALEQELKHLNGMDQSLSKRLNLLETEKSKLDGEANARSKAVADARTAVSAARDAVANAEAEAGLLAPWPAVAWLRHAALPVVAGMPMTREAASAVAPLESRELAPFVTRSETKDKLLMLATLTWNSARSFAALGETVAFRSLAPAWPQADGMGVPFTAFGVQVELFPRPGAADPWTEIEFAARYDYSALDEAFATADLPPVQDAPTQDDEREAAPTRAAATTLDWPLMKQFWDDQRRRRELAMVFDSYLGDFRKPASPETMNVTTLIGGVIWPVGIAFDAGHKLNGLPYGAISFDGYAPASGNTALKGLSGKISWVAGTNTIEIKPGSGDLNIRGWSPSSFERDGFLTDNQGFGVKDPRANAKGIITRSYRALLTEQAKVFASALQPIESTGAVRFGFWFKDVPLNAAGTFGESALEPPLEPHTSTDFKSWLKPEEGCEWRLYRADIGAEAFEDGRDRFPFFGLALEPLRLQHLKLPLDADGMATSRLPSRVEILARVFFADDAEQPIEGGNLIWLVFAASGDELQLVNVVAVGKLQQLHFAFEAFDDRGGRQILLKATPQWAVDKFVLTGVDVTLPLYGHRVILEGATADCVDTPTSKSAGSVSINWTAGQPVAIKPGQGRLRVSKLDIKSDVHAVGRFNVDAEPRKPSLTLASVVEICTEQGRAGAPEFAIEFAAGATTSFRLLGSKFGLQNVDWREDDQAIVLRWSGKITTSGPPLPGFDLTSAEASLFVAARLERPSEKKTAILSLLCGRCEGEMFSARSSSAAGGEQAVDQSSGIRVDRFRWQVERRKSRLPKRPNDSDTRENNWRGFAAIDGALHNKTSAIEWPQVATSSGGSPGRRRVARIEGRPSLAHRVTYTFLDHRLPLEICELGDTKVETSWRLGRPWAVFAIGEHVVSEIVPAGTSAKSVSWTGIESIAIGRAVDLVPKLPKDKVIEAVTFAARYRHPYSGAAATPDMIQPGLGALQTVLQGTFGRAFRQGFWQKERDAQLLVVAGFLGVHAGGVDQHQILLRLPFLAVIGGGTEALGADTEALGAGSLKQSAIPDPGIELAWVDTGAARALVVRDAHALAPATGREADLWSAIRTGALIDDKADPPKGDLVAAIMVEQSFRAAPPAETPPADWKLAPYWITSAVTVSRIFEQFAAVPGAFRPLSILSGSVRDGNRTRGASALLKPVLPKLKDKRSAAIEPVLITGGSELAVESWTGGDAASVNGYAAGLALARHARPLFAIVRTDKQQRGNYTAIRLPATVASELPQSRNGSREQTRFAEPARGYAVAPGSGTLRWLSPVAEGPTAPVRDETGTLASGLAGLARSVQLPAQAGKEVAIVEPHSASELPRKRLEELARQLVWFTEKRVPVYLPLPLENLEAPPIPWLQAAPPRARLPDDGDVAMVLHGAGLGDTRFSPVRSAAQAFVPAAMDALTVSERAGVVTARRAFMIGTVEQAPSFDAVQSRFGRPGQTGSSVRRWMRTPRPTQLPDNVGDSARDRKPEASPLLPRTPLRYLVGPADTVRGTGWSATFIAAPFSDGVVSDRWDGTIRLRVELDVGSDPGGETAAGRLAKCLFPQRENATDVQAKALASIKVGDTLIEYRWLSFVSEGSHWTALDTRMQAYDSTTSGPVVWRSHIEIVLDPRERCPEAASEPASAHARIASALQGGAFSAELRLTLHPSDLGPNPVAVNKGAVALSLGETSLAEGVDRPPVTLRWTLPAVTAASGGMPLLPTTMLFVDPAYETDLANPPHEKLLIVDTKDVTDLPGNRGAVRAMFFADRGRVNRRGTIAFMTDVRFERPADPILRSDAEDDFDAPAPAALPLKIKHIPRAAGGKQQSLNIAGMRVPRIKFATVYELSLGALVAEDDTPARLEAGDVLILTVAENPIDAKTEVQMKNSESGTPPSKFPLAREQQFELSLHFTVTDEPVVEPPSALYAALILSSANVGSEALSLPLYAQSPLPWRVDFRNLKADFRKGMVRRSATFVWALARTRSEVGDVSKPSMVHAYIVKMDRNGQAYLPESITELLPPQRPWSSRIISAKWTGDENPKRDVQIIGLELKQNAKPTDVQFAAQALPGEDAFAVHERAKTKCKARSLQVNSTSQQARVRIRTETDEWTAWADIA